MLLFNLFRKYYFKLKFIELKSGLLRDIYKIVIPDDWLEDGKVGANTCTKNEVGGFVTLYDETVEKAKAK